LLGVVSSGPRHCLAGAACCAGRWTFRPTCGGFGIARLVSAAGWPIAILRTVSLGAGLAWAGSGTHRPHQRCLFRIGRAKYVQWFFGEACRQACWHSTRRTGNHLPGGRCPRWPFLCGGCGAYGVGRRGCCCSPISRHIRRLNRWFLTIAGSMDAITPTRGLRQALLMVKHPLRPWRLAPPLLASFAAIVVAHDRLSVA
jgi:hypothetical protein